MKKLIPIMLLPLVFCGCSSDTFTEKSSFLMGTYVSIEAKTSAEAVDSALKRVSDIEQALSAKLAESELAEINSAEGEFSVSEELYSVMAVCEEIGAASDGALDVRMGELSDLWGIGTEEAGIPSEEEISDALARMGSVSVSQNGGEYYLTKSGVFRLDLGAAAKGYAADEAAKVLAENGCDSAIVNIGGNIFALGNNNGNPWNIGIATPDSNEIAGTLSLTNCAAATSGDYQRYFEQNGVRYHHILDPKTGYPCNSDIRSVTIVCESALYADALSTAVFVLGAEDGLALIESLSYAECVIINEDGEIITSSGAPFTKK